MDSDYIVIQNAHANNLKNISTEIPKHKVVAFTGVSGSGVNADLKLPLFADEKLPVPRPD